MTDLIEGIKERLKYQVSKGKKLREAGPPLLR